MGGNLQGFHVRVSHRRCLCILDLLPQTALSLTSRFLSRFSDLVVQDVTTHDFVLPGR